MRYPPEKLRRIYIQRFYDLRALGFKSYREYLLSDLWQSIRSKVLIDNPLCLACGRQASQVHHTVYIKKVLSGRSLKGLISVCGGCHFKAEFRKNDHAKLAPKQATAKLRLLSTLTDKSKKATFSCP